MNRDAEICLKAADQYEESARRYRESGGGGKHTAIEHDKLAAEFRDLAKRLEEEKKTPAMEIPGGAFDE